MADLQKIVSILFQGDDQVSQSINSISGNISGLSDVASDAVAPWADLTDNILKADAALAALAVGGLALAFQKSMQFESSVLELQKVLGDTESSDAAITAAKGLSDEYGQSANDILASMAGFRQAGFDLSESMTLTKDSLDLVIAGNLDATQSSQLIIAALKGFGESADEARRYVDILNETSNNYATDVQQLAEGMSRIAPIARIMGFSMEETAGLLTPVIEIFGSGTEAADGLKTGLLKLIDDSKPVREALTSIGVSQFEANGQMRAGKDIYLDVAKAFLTLDENQKLFVTQQLVGIEQSARMVQVFDNLSLSTEITSRAMDAAGSAAREVALRLESAEVSVNRFKVGFENLAVTIGDQFRLAAQGAIDGGTAIENALTDIIKSGAFDPIFERINDFSKDLGELLSTVAKNLPEAFNKVNFDNLFEAFDDLTEEIKDAFESVFGEIDLTTVDGLTDAIQKAINGLTGLVNVTSGILQGLTPVFDAIGFGIKNFSDMGEEGQKLAGVFLGVTRDIKFLVDSLDLFKIALLPLAGATMINAGVNVLTLGSSALSSAGAMGGLITSLNAIAAHPAFKVLAAAGIGWVIGTYIRDLTPAVDDAAQGFFRLVDKVINFSGQKGNVNLTPNLDDIGKSAADTAGSVSKIPENLDKIPDKKESTITIDGTEYSIEQLKLIREGMALENKTVSLEINANVTKAESNINVLKYQLEDGTWASIKIDADKKTLTKTTDALKKNLDPFKTLEIKSELDIAKLNADAKKFSDLMSVFNTKIEWAAKIDIAEIEADAKKVQAAFESIGSSVVAVSGTVESMFSGLTKATSSVHFNELLEVLKTEMKTQDKLVDAQIKLIDAQIASMAKGEAMFTISGENVSQGARAFMMDVLKEIQIEMSGNAQSYLMGAA